MKILKNTFYALGLVLFVTVMLLVIAGRFGIGGVRALVVQSGSMEPTIGTKSIVLTMPAANYTEGDIITFKHSGRDNVLVTHRIVEVNPQGDALQYTTKGDANEEKDGEKVPADYVVGKVAFSVPFVGELISFVQTMPGFIMLIAIPAAIIIYSEILSIKNQISNYLQKRKQKKLLKPLETS